MEKKKVWPGFSASEGLDDERGEEEITKQKKCAELQG